MRLKTLKTEFFCEPCGKACKTSGDVAVRIADHDRDTGVGALAKGRVERQVTEEGDAKLQGFGLRSAAPGALMRASLWRWLGVPLLLALLATILFAVPVQVAGLRLPEPLWMMPLVFAWPLIKPSVSGPLAILVAGIFLDLFWQGALGLWPLAMLTGYAAVLFARPLIVGQSPLILAAWYVGVTAVTFSAATLLTIFDLRAAPQAAAIGLQAFATVLLYPAAYRLLDAFEDVGSRVR